MNKEDYDNLKEMIIDFDEYSTDYTKTRCKELQKTVENTLKEIERLQNIIDELENRILVKLNRYYGEKDYRISHYDLEELFDKLKELKEGNKDE